MVKTFFTMNLSLSLVKTFFTTSLSLPLVQIFLTINLSLSLVKRLTSGWGWCHFRKFPRPGKGNHSNRDSACSRTLYWTLHRSKCRIRILLDWLVKFATWNLDYMEKKLNNTWKNNHLAYLQTLIFLLYMLLLKKTDARGTFFVSDTRICLNPPLISGLKINVYFRTWILRWSTVHNHNKKSWYCAKKTSTN